MDRPLEIPVGGSVFDMYYLYILQSESSGRFYVGHCENLLVRFHQHRNGYSKSTRGRGPWWMPYWEVHPTRSAAMARERALKAMKSSQGIRRLIAEKYPELRLVS